jgi:anti-repressor protein
MEGLRMNELIKVNYDNADRPTVFGRDLHEFLEVDSNYTTWFNRMCEYGFAEEIDFLPFLRESTGGRPATDHQLTISMAKEICMIQRSEKGKIARQYFLKLEEAWNTPEMVMSRALRMAEARINQLAIENSQLTVDNAIMKPKAEYFDELVDRNLLTSFRETAKELGIKEKIFVSFLIEKKYIYRDKKGKLQPYAGRGDGLFEVKETYNEKTKWSGTQTLITAKGREIFQNLSIQG